MKKLLLLAATAMLGLSVARADPTFELSRSFSDGSVDPADPAPWVTLAFNNNPDTIQGGVLLTITASLTGDEHIKEVYFNYTGTALSAAFVAGGTGPNGTFSFSADPESTGQNGGFKADGDGYFNAKISFATGSFTGNEVSTFLLTSTGISSGDFNKLSVGSGNSPQGLYAAAHIGTTGLDGEGSAWITTVPEIPGLHAALLLALPMGLAAVRRFRAKKS